MICFGGRSRAAHGGFTLLEVLVVIATIALLLAIALPGLRRARAQSHQVMCQARLHQIAVAWSAYLDDHRGHFLQQVNANVNYGGRQGAAAVFRIDKPLNAYVKLPLRATETELFRCPTDAGMPSARPRCYDYYGTSFQTNLMLIGPDQLGVNPADPCRPVLETVNLRLRKLNRSRVSTPASRLPLIGDFGWVAAYIFNNTQRGDWHERPTLHDIAFLDGHVAPVLIAKGLYVTSTYAVIPFRDLLPEAARLQAEVKP